MNRPVPGGWPGLHRLLLLVLASVLVAGAAPAALADPPPSSSVKEATKHFRRGVTLYNEADYRGALAEFRRAYDIAPNATVLYNIGETQYQLQNYAAALTMFERYLNESASNAPHRHEVEQTMETLRTRVGKLRITTNVPGCEITVDDELIGRTPFEAPVLVSVGRRKVTAMYVGRTPDTRFAEVAAGDTGEVALTVLDAGRGTSGPAGSPGPVGPPGSAGPSGPSDGGFDFARAGWFVTGGLGAATVTTGVLAYLASRQLQDARKQFTTRPELDQKASRATTLAIAADVLGAATVVAGAITLKLTLSRSPSHEVHVAVVPGGVVLAGAFH